MPRIDDQIAVFSLLRFMPTTNYANNGAVRSYAASLGPIHHSDQMHSSETIASAYRVLTLNAISRISYLTSIFALSLGCQTARAHVSGVFGTTREPQARPTPNSFRMHPSELPGARPLPVFTKSGHSPIASPQSKRSKTSTTGAKVLHLGLVLFSHLSVGAGRHRHWLPTTANTGMAPFGGPYLLKHPQTNTPRTFV